MHMFFIKDICNIEENFVIEMQWNINFFIPKKELHITMKVICINP